MSIAIEDYIVQLAQQLINEQATQAQQATLDTVLQAVNGVNANLAAFEQQTNNSFETVLQLLNRMDFELQRLVANAAAPVILPQQPPQGYGGPATSDVADAVWGFPLANATPFTTGEAQDTMMGHFYILSNNGHTDNIDGNPGYKVTGHDSETPANFSGPNQGFLDFSTILPTDASIFAWATRVYPSSPWQHGPNGTVFERDSANAVLLWYIDLSEQQFRQWQAGFSTAAARVPPVWPGLSHVTLGTAVALADGLIVTGPLDGVIVKITAVPNPIGFYSFGSRKSFVHVGGIVFVDDNGEAEQSIPLGLEDEVICSRLTQHPTSATVRLKSGVVGTIQPWLMS